MRLAADIIGGQPTTILRDGITLYKYTVICKHLYSRYTALHKMQGHWHFNIIDKTFYEYTGSMHGFGYIW